MLYATSVTLPYPPIMPHSVAPILPPGTSRPPLRVATLLSGAAILLPSGSCPSLGAAESYYDEGKYTSFGMLDCGVEPPVIDRT